MNAKITVAVFCILLFSITIFNALVPDRVMSENENRYLQQRPDFSWSALVDGRFTSAFEAYITDQFAARDEWVGAKTVAERMAGRSSSKGIYFAADNYLIEMFDSIDAEVYRRNLGYVADFSERVEKELGIPVYTMLIPTAPAILRDKLPAFAPELDQDTLLAEANEALPHFIDVTETLRDHRAEYIYYRTDHHWTSLGAYYAYNDWRRAQGLEDRSAEEYSTEVLSDQFYGTTWSKANLYSIPPDTLEAWLPDTGPFAVDYNFEQSSSDSIYERGFLEMKDKYSVYLNANQPIVQITTSVQNEKKLLLIKDSYANTFAQLQLADFSEIHIVDLRFYRQSAYEYIAENGITDVLVQYNLKGFAGDQSLLFLVQPLAS